MSSYLSRYVNYANLLTTSPINSCKNIIDYFLPDFTILKSSDLKCFSNFNSSNCIIILSYV